ncbi:MAG: sensor domain-containing diguanylate cyclase [Gammaproteobacteria bacterium]|nr:sensor domain-containing diguanylate cyclase [Gammaproteobacteria bacterium]
MEQAKLLGAYLDAVREMRRGKFTVEWPEIGGDDPVAQLGRELSQLGRWLDQRFEENRRVQAIFTEISGGGFTHEVLERVYDTFHALIPYDRIGCALLTEDQRRLQAWWVRSSHPEKMRLTRGYQAALAGSSLETILATGAPRILNDLETYLQEHPGSISTQLIVAEGIRSSLTCPLVAEGKPVGFLFFSSRKKNTYRDLHQTIFLEIADHLSVLIERSRFCQQIHDLNQQLLRTQHELKEQALRDILTGAFNRGAIMAALAEQLSHARRKGLPLSVIMADIDHFKAINDTHGHLGGDLVLKRVAVTLQGCLRDYDQLGRYGGEEFLLVLGETPLETAQQVAERIRAAVEGLLLEVEGRSVRVTISLGVASLEPVDGDDVTPLVGRADGALYAAKRAGRNRVCLAGPAG